MWWLVPAGIVVVGAIPVLVMVRRVARDAAALRVSLVKLGELSEPLADLKHRVVSMELPKRSSPAP